MPQQDRTSHFSGDLHRRNKTISTAIGFFGLLLLAIIAYAGWSANQTATERERTLLKNAFNQSIARALNEQKSVAWWDDSVVKITDEAIDLDFVDANFGIFLTETYGHDEVYILNADDRPLYAFADAERREPSNFERRRSSVEEVIADGVTGFVVDTVEEAVAATRRIAALDRRHCRQVFEHRFSAARMARDYIRVYEQLVAAGPAAIVTGAAS